ncbi:MAG: hypothetical protein Q9163_005328 [Psora crenata]
MHLFVLLGYALLAKTSAADYVLEDNYAPESFFSGFSFFTGADPTHGYVTYVDQGTAQSQGLVNTNNGQVHMGVDSTNVASGSGRLSVRITSNKSYNHGLFILDAGHMPGGICGTWPAFWMVGPDWPNQGEIDILEGVNDNANNAVTLHTSDGCSIREDGTFTGTLGTTNCYVNAPGQSPNVGCAIESQDTRSYGSGFNSIGGGVMATEWTSSAISVWFFPRGTIPADITNGAPEPRNWGQPVARFQGACDIDSHFKNQQIVFDTTFCGDWAGSVWGTSAHCSSLASNCQDYVQNNPRAFADAYWTINSLKTYRATGASIATSQNAITGEVKGKNNTLPLLSAPLAKGGGLPEREPAHRLELI